MSSTSESKADQTSGSELFDLPVENIKMTTNLENKKAKVVFLKTQL